MLFTTTKSKHLGVACKTPCIALHILIYEMTCKIFKHFKVLNIQPHKVTNLKFNIFWNLIGLFLIICLCFSQDFFFPFAFISSCFPPIFRLFLPP